MFLSLTAKQKLGIHYGSAMPTGPNIGRPLMVGFALNTLLIVGCVEKICRSEQRLGLSAVIIVSYIKHILHRPAYITISIHRVSSNFMWELINKNVIKFQF